DAARLRRNGDIAAVREANVAVQHRLFALRARANDLGVTRLAVSAPRSLGTAVARNRERRRLREAFRIVVKDRRAAIGRDVLVTALRDMVAAPPAAVSWAGARGHGSQGTGELVEPIGTRVW